MRNNKLFFPMIISPYGKGSVHNYYIANEEEYERYMEIENPRRSPEQAARDNVAIGYLCGFMGLIVAMTLCVFLWDKKNE